MKSESFSKTIDFQLCRDLQFDNFTANAIVLKYQLTVKPLS